jgi:type VI secretion system secreted protein VgrG
MPPRQAVISLPIEQAAHLERFEAVERLSELFVIHADVICEEAEVDFLPHLGEGALITMTEDAASHRALSGLLFEAEFLDEVEAGYRYRLTLRPWLYALTRNLDYFIFQNKTTVQIIEDIFNKRGCSDADFSKLSGTYPVREYCVQYRESDFTFISRLMEEEGIYYFFDHRNGRHVMVLCDGRGSHPQSYYESLSYIPHGQDVLADRFWRWTERVVTGAEGKATLRNYDFERPSLQLEGSYALGQLGAAAGGGGAASSRIAGMVNEQAPIGQAMPAEKAEVYDYPAAFMDDQRGGTLSETKIEAAHNMRRSYHGQGDPIWIACGHLLSLEKHPLGRLNQDYLIVSLRYQVDAEAFVSGQAARDDQSIAIEIEATPANTPWRAPFVTPRPVARGPETAVVTGPSGETLYTDKYGRVKVRFFWDRAPASPDNTCWIRVSEGSADSGFGHIAIPRVGQEVVVDFIDGDPDRPLITGRVYNAVKMPPYPLPDDKTRSVWRSHTIDGGADDYNEISMEDKSGSEEMKVQAQKDRNTLVKNNDTTIVKNNLSMTVQQGDETRAVQQGKRTTTIQQDEALTVSQGNMSTTVSMGNKTTGVSMGNYSLKTDLGAVTIEAMQSITLKVGGNSVVIDPTGVTIKGIMITAQAQAQLSASAPMVSISGDAMTQIQGGIVMIN